MIYEQTNFASDGRGVTVPAFQNQKKEKKISYFNTRFDFINKLDRNL